jgi:hypothetical protein
VCPPQNAQLSLQSQPGAEKSPVFPLGALRTANLRFFEFLQGFLVHPANGLLQYFSREEGSRWSTQSREEEKGQNLIAI